MPKCKGRRIMEDGRMHSICGQVLLRILVLISICGLGGVQPETQVCRDRIPFGLATGKIPTDRITASSVYNSDGDIRHYGASQARLGIASVWCGSDRATWRDDWIRIAFESTVNVTGMAIETGWFDNPSGIATKVYLQFSTDGVHFQNQTDKTGKDLIQTLSIYSSATHYFWFDAIPAAFLRIRPLELLVTSTQSKFCGRFEIFGCRSSRLNDDLYPFGLESRVTSDSHITASSSMPDYPPFHARLNFPSSWCPATNTNAWIQVDLERALLVKGIATQGHYGRLSTAMVSSYSVSFANESSGSFTFIRNGSQNKSFSGNNQTAEDPVFSQIDPPFIARYIRIHPLTAYNGNNTGKMCMRVELYASFPGCDSILTSSESTQMYTVEKGIPLEISPDIDIYSSKFWCGSEEASSSREEQTETLRIDLGEIKLVTGIIISGNPNTDGWVTNYDVQYGLLSSDMDLLDKGFPGSSGRASVVVNWLKAATVVRYLEITPKQYVGNKCLRVRVLGCSSIPTTADIPKMISVTPTSHAFLIKIKMNAYPVIKGVIVTLSCPESIETLPCSKPMTNIFPDSSINNGTFHVINLQPWTKYKFSIRYIFNDSQSSECNATSITTLETKPSQSPRQCRIVTVNSTSISLSWTHLSEESSNGVIVGYQISLRAVNMNGSYTEAANASALRYDVTGMDPNTFYYIQIKAVNKAGSGPPCILSAQTMSKVPGSSSGEDDLAVNSAVALISCSAGVMLIVLTCILVKASCEKVKSKKGRHSSGEHMKRIKKKTLVEFLESGEKKVDTSTANDCEKLQRMVRESKASRKSLLLSSPMNNGNLKSFENLKTTTQSSRHQAWCQDAICKKIPVSNPRLEMEEKQRKIGIDNSGFKNAKLDSM